MSTCQGAPPPHEECPHGEACDWAPAPSLATLREFAELADHDRPRPPANRAERRAAARGRPY